jgi:hypothetical protein
MWHCCPYLPVLDLSLPKFHAVPIQLSHAIYALKATVRFGVTGSALGMPRGLLVSQIKYHAVPIQLSHVIYAHKATVRLGVTGSARGILRGGFVGMAKRVLA